jgi:hypothetical protein
MSLYRWARIAQIIARHASRKAKSESDRAERKAARQRRPANVVDDVWWGRSMIVDGLLACGWNRLDAIQAAARLTAGYKSEAERIHDAVQERVHGTVSASEPGHAQS